MQLRLVSLTGPIKTLESREVPDDQALAVVTEHASSGGFHDVRKVLDCDGYSIRFTATTPGGRHGRNIAFGDF